MAPTKDNQCLWQDALDAYEKYLTFLDLKVAVATLGDYFADQEGVPLPDRLPPDLRGLLLRAQQLHEDFDKHEEIAKEAFQASAWAYAAAEWDLQRGDLVECASPGAGAPHVIHADDLTPDDSHAAGEFWLNGRILKKDGKPGQRRAWLPLFRDDWRNLSLKGRR